MSKYRDEEVSAFLLQSAYSLKQIIRVAKMLKKSENAMHDEQDAEYMMGRAPMPSGYMKRRCK